MMLTIDRFHDDELPLPAEMAVEVRQFFRDWASELASSPTWLVVMRHHD
jgi:hypothetical protein